MPIGIRFAAGPVWNSRRRSVHQAALATIVASGIYAAVGWPFASAADAQATTVIQSPQQRAAVMLGQWEGCIRDAAQKRQAASLKNPDKVAKYAEAQCTSFDKALRPVVREALQAMMYSSSEGEVIAQTDVAMGVLRRHIHVRAGETVDQLRTRQSAAAAR